jgi:membrane-associated phospholipid phosphatase
MTILHKLDQRLLDQRLTTTSSAGVSPGLPTRPRYNTQIMARFIDTSDPKAKPLCTRMFETIRYNEYWDADVQSYMYLHDFIKACPDWITELAAVATSKGTPSQSLHPDQLDRQILEILDLAPEREERFLEVIDQDDADGAVNYWLGMLQISPARHPATYLMVRVGRRIGEHVAMCLKGLFRSPRPSELCPGIIPMIDPPATPSFPAGHAVQSYLISCLLAGSLPNMPQLPKTLFELADRVSMNRVVAGLHFPTDIEAGKAVGIACCELLTRISSIWSLDPITKADEFSQKEADESSRKVADEFSRKVADEFSRKVADEFSRALPGGTKGKSLRALVQAEFPQYA